MHFACILLESTCISMSRSRVLVKVGLSKL